MAAHVGNGQDRVYREVRIAGADDNQVGSVDCVADGAAQVCIGRAHVGDVEDDRLAAAAHEVMLEGQIALVSVDERAHGFVGHGQNGAGHTKTAPQPVSDFGEGVPLAQPLVAAQMHGQVAIANAEPLLATDRAEGFERGKGVVAPTPAHGRILHAGQVVENGVQIRADGEAPVLEVVARVHKHRERTRRQHRLEAGGHLGPAHAARQRQYTR